MTTFADLGLSPALLKNLAAENHETPTPIQARAIPELMAGRDLLGIAQTGTGKTAAFALPILQRLSALTTRPEPRRCRALVLSPTRELAAQIAQSFRTYGRNTKVSSTVVFGGTSIGRQIEALSRGVDVLIATPGRLVDLMERGAVSLASVEVLVLDEVDQMLDLGFIHAIRQLTRTLPKTRQNLFFSATMPKEIAGLAGELLKDPVRVEVTPVASTVERINQSVIHARSEAKPEILSDLLLAGGMTRALVFSRTKHGADRLVKQLAKNEIQAAAIHGNKSQNQRERALAEFRKGNCQVLVATDIAARGLHIDGVTHVVNFDLPNVPESYVHRIGRTARAGAEGIAIAFCAPDERGLLRDIERTIRQTLPVADHALGLKPGERVPSSAGAPARGRPAQPNWRGGKPAGSGGGQRQHPAAERRANANANSGKPSSRPGGRSNAPRRAAV